MSMVICGSLLSACGGNSNTTSEGSGNTEAKAKVAEIVFALPSFNRIPDDLSKVTNAINAITTEKIGVKVDFRLFGPADYAQKVNLALQSGEKNGRLHHARTVLQLCVQESGGSARRAASRAW
ncbi:hypothetical protein ACFSQ7_15185 [Paenibacillus rhizoplanae]